MDEEEEEEEVMGLAALTGPDLFDFFTIANRLRVKLGNTIELCAITNAKTNAKSGRCPEDCRPLPFFAGQTD